MKVLPLPIWVTTPTSPWCTLTMCLTMARAEAGAAELAAAGAIDAVEAFEEAGQMVGGDAAAAIADGRCDPLPVPGGRASYRCGPVRCI